MSAVFGDVHDASGLSLNPERLRRHGEPTLRAIERIFILQPDRDVSVNDRIAHIS
jgi:hypothetical protein